ncbi:MAG: cytochrome P450 [Pseudomonadota bacterium]
MTEPVFEPTRDGFMNDPFPDYARLRAHGPVHHHGESGIFFVLDYDLAQHVMKDPETFSSVVDRARMREGGLPKRVEEIKAQGYQLAPTLSHNDTPSHADFRSVVQPLFMPAALRAQQEGIQKRIETLWSAIPMDEEIDFVSAFSVPLPIGVIGDYLGLSHYGDDQLKEWSDAFADEIGFQTSDDRAIRVAELMLECHQAMDATIQARRDDPREDIISHLALASLPDGRRMEIGELLSILTQLLVAGNETTTNSLSAGILRLSEHPELAARLRETPKLMSRFVEELLRLEAPVQGQFRIATRDVDLGGTTVPKGSRVHIRFAAANRDPDIYGGTADTVILDTVRKKQHMSFGAGMHFCVGALLSRMELRLAFNHILANTSAIEAHAALHELPFAPSFHLRGMLSLPVTFRA